MEFKTDHYGENAILEAIKMLFNDTPLLELTDVYNRTRGSVVKLLSLGIYRIV